MLLGPRMDVRIRSFRLEQGVEKLIDLLKDELEMNMRFDIAHIRLMGVTRLDQLKPEMVVNRCVSFHYGSKL